MVSSRKLMLTGLAMSSVAARGTQNSADTTTVQYPGSTLTAPQLAATPYVAARDPKKGSKGKNSQGGGGPTTAAVAASTKSDTRSKASKTRSHDSCTASTPTLTSTWTSGTSTMTTEVPDPSYVNPCVETTTETMSGTPSEGASLRLAPPLGLSAKALKRWLRKNGGH